MGLSNVMTQSGWQFETQIVSLESGNQALMEWVFLLGGMESEENRPYHRGLPDHPSLPPVRSSVRARDRP